MSVPVAAAEERVTNGDFSAGSSGWTVSTSGSNSYSLGEVNFDGYDAQLQTAIYSSSTTTAYARLYQSVDLTNVNTLTFMLHTLSSQPNTGGEFLVYVDSDQLARFDYSEIPSEWESYSIDVSGYSGYHTIEFYQTMATGMYDASLYLGVILDDVSAMSTGQAPTYDQSYLNNDLVKYGEEVVAYIGVNAGVPDTTFYVNWGDGQSSSSTTTSQGHISDVFTHTYTSPGTYTVTGSAFTSGVGSTDSFTIGTVDVVTLDFTAAPTSGDPPLDVQFSVSGENIASVVWDFGDGTTSTAYNPVHTYAASATPYTVTLTGYTSTGKSIPVVKEDLIISSAQRVLWNATSYTAGDSAEITWQLRNPDFNSYQYTLQILASDSQGNTIGNSIITPVTINDATGNHVWDTEGYAGYYTAAVYQSGITTPLAFGVTNIVKEATLTVNLATSGSTYTNATTVSLTQNGVIVSTQTTSTGQAQFTIPTGSYLVSATTTGYATQSATVNLIESTAITIDFITGTTDNPYPSGSGQYYPSTYATFRVLDKKYGTEVSGATITGYAVEATNPIEWLANIYGQAWGGKIIGSEINAITDENGLASFVMFTNVRYTLSLSHPDLPNPVNRTFALTSLSTEYPWYIDIPHEAPSTGQTDIKTTASVDTSGLINITYTDLSASTTLVTVSAYKKDDQNNYTISMGNPATAIGNENTIQLQLENFAGADVKIIVTAETTAHGTVERTYYHTFPGPWLDLGLPHNIYIWICLITAILLGGITPFVNSHACCFVICFIEWAYWMFGWFFDIGQGVAAFLLMMATILSIAYYIASRR